MKFYAIEWTYGRASNFRGERYGQYYAFASKAEREKWIEEHMHKTRWDKGFREEISAQDSELRRFKRKLRDYPDAIIMGGER